jgi:nitrogen fixation protein NifZ
MGPCFEYGARVRVVRNLRNDGTFPGVDTGVVLVRCGSVGYVRDVGTYLQDQIIYAVVFPDGDRVVGCREAELIDADVPWTPSLFEARDKVAARVALAIGGEVIVTVGEAGEVVDVLRDLPQGVAYHVRFGARTLQVPETALGPMVEAPEDVAPTMIGESDS